MANFTRDAIKASFIKLLEQRPLAQISVKDIVSDCGVNRNTFYYYFQDIPQLLEHIVEEDAERIIQKYPTVDSIEACLDAAVEFALAHRRAVLHIHNSVNRAVYEQYLWKVCEYAVGRYVDTLLTDHPMRNEDRDVLIQSEVYAAFGAVMYWLEHGMKEDLRVPFHRICELKKGFIDEIVRRGAEEL